MEAPEFISFPKIYRYSREVIVTEKLDGTNAQILVNDTGDDLIAGSRNRWIKPGEDGFGFASWVEANKSELLRLGPGSHFGEWWGAGIQRRYGLKDKRFSLFNTSRWSEPATRPACVGVVPVIWSGKMDDMPLDDIMKNLATFGSVAAPGFMKPEGVVIFHVPSQAMFKKTLDKDDQPKGA